MKFKVRWKRSHEGYVESKDGRWRISPQFMSTTRAQGYECRDMKTGKKWSADQISHLKFDVDNIVSKEAK
jgi:hypothetical protein